MIDHQKVERALTNLSGEIADFQQALGQTQSRLAQALADFAQEPFDRVRQQVSDKWWGAIPTEEWARFPDMRVPFETQWTTHQEARDWAYEHILNVPTFAVDGSQIPPTTDFSVPIAVVQIGWFENRHTLDGDYVKDNRVEVIPPRQLIVDGEVSRQAVDMIRTRLEMRRISEYIAAQESVDSKPIVFYDGPLLLSFAERLRDTKIDYVNELMRLLNLSDEHQVPILGYVDSSHSHDIVELISKFYGLSDIKNDQMTDGLLLNKTLRLGDRTPVMISRRDGIQKDYTEPWRSELGFVYLKMSDQNMPARIEFPLWLYETGQLDRIINVIRAEIIIGNGYPYCIETADVTALLTHQDRQFFYRIFQAFMEKNGWNLRMRTKAQSKNRRR